MVKERLQREGLPSMSRRNFLRLAGAGAAGGLIAPRLTLARPARLQEMGQVVDLTHVFGTNVPTYVLSDTATREDTVTVANDGFYIQRWSFGEHTGTHVDIPAHFIEDGETVDNYPADLLVSTAVVIDIAARAEEDPNTMLTVEDIEAWESENGEIPPGALVAMYSGWETKWNDIAAFRGDPGDGSLNFPGFHPDAAAFLVEERDIHGIAVDTLSLDNGPSATFDVHYTILGAGKYGVENVANLAQLKDTLATVIVGVNRWEEGSGGPARVLALL
jgi:kynurenine formamidase